MIENRSKKCSKNVQKMIKNFEKCSKNIRKMFKKYSKNVQKKDEQKFWIKMFDNAKKCLHFKYYTGQKQLENFCLVMFSVFCCIS